MNLHKNVIGLVRPNKNLSNLYCRTYPIECTRSYRLIPSNQEHKYLIYLFISGMFLPNWKESVKKALLGEKAPTISHNEARVTQ